MLSEHFFSCLDSVIIFEGSWKHKFSTSIDNAQILTGKTREIYAEINSYDKCDVRQKTHFPLRHQSEILFSLFLLLSKCQVTFISAANYRDLIIFTFRWFRKRKFCFQFSAKKSKIDKKRENQVKTS